MTFQYLCSCFSKQLKADKYNRVLHVEVIWEEKGLTFFEPKDLSAGKYV